PFSVAFIWDDRNDMIRPTRGSRIILKVAHTNRALLSDYEFTRFVADAGYLFRVFSDDYVFGVRANGTWIEAPSRSAPFWELAELGGKDTLRGYFPHRFAGKGRILLNTEFRALLTQFDFFNVWHVKIDGVLEGEMGRVFLEKDQARSDFGLTAADTRH